jgi:hypothetical protein
VLFPLYVESRATRLDQHHKRQEEYETVIRTSAIQGPTRAVFAVSAAVVILSVCLVSPAEAASKAFTKTDSYCQDKDASGNPVNPCAALVYANGGAYQVKSTVVEARDNSYDTNPACNNVSLYSNNSLNLGDYGVFIVPAPCSYKLTIDINGGDNKGNQVYITPGCQLVLESKGTSLNDNKPHKKSIDWTDGAKTKLAAQGITVSNNDVSDVYWHKAQGQGNKHACKMD